VLDDALEELSVGTVLHEDVDLLLPADDLVDLGDVLMHQSLLQQDLSLDRLHLLGVACLHGKHLHCHYLAGEAMDCSPDAPVSALPYLLL
jgi:hypothetical protein